MRTGALTANGADGAALERTAQMLQLGAGKDS